MFFFSISVPVFGVSGYAIPFKQLSAHFKILVRNGISTDTSQALLRGNAIPKTPTPTALATWAELGSHCFAWISMATEPGFIHATFAPPDPRTKTIRLVLAKK
jgi:hypothetical protein